MNRLVRRPAYLASKSSFSTANSRLWKNNAIGVVRETYGMWERRTPLCPEHVTALVDHGYQVHVQPSTRRIFSDAEYLAAGAQVKEDLSDCGLVLGVKQVPPSQLLPDRAYMFFSHTIKGQEENMPLLDECLSRNINLIDYECLVEHKDGLSTGRRLVAFGKYAGIAGFVEILQGLGQQLLADGFSTPFLSSPQCFMHDSLQDAEGFLRAMGDKIRTQGLPESLGPLTFAFTGGQGNVSLGAQSMFKHLPHRFVTTEELKHIVETNPEEARHCVYGVVLEPDDLVRRVSDGGFDLNEYFTEPHKYEPIFHEKVAPYTSVLVNGMYWDHMYPKLLTQSQLTALSNRGTPYAGRPLHLRAIADITCDINGSVGMLTRSTTMDAPYFEWDVQRSRESDHMGAAEVGVAVLGVDILPTALPRESSKHFGDHLVPLLTHTSSEAALELQNACITSGGELTPPFKYIEKYRQVQKLSNKAHASGAREDVVLRGHLFDTKLINDAFDLIEKKGGHFEVMDIHVIPNKTNIKKTSQVVLRVSAKSEEKLQSIAEELKGFVASQAEAEASMEQLPYTHAEADEAALQEQAAQDLSDAKHVLLLGAGLVSPPFVEFLTRPERVGEQKRKVTVVSHIADEAMKVAEYGHDGLATPRALDILGADANKLDELIQEVDVVFGTNMVTASYVSDGMRELHDQAKAKGVVLFNEMGLDPGMDHMSAMRVIDLAKQKGATVTSFRSVCGGLTSPDALDPTDPFQYKFSWSPAGVFTAAMSTARFLEQGKEIVQDGALKLRNARHFDGWKCFNLEEIPNRDSLVYGDLYDIPQASTVFRGTLRFRGWCSLVDSMHSLGLLDADASPLPMDKDLTWGRVLQTKAEAEGYSSVQDYMLAKCGEEKTREALDALTYLGASPDSKVHGSGTPSKKRPLDAFVDLLTEKNSLNPGEKDLVLMQHDFGFSWPDGKESTHRSSFMSLGDSDHTAMAKTVGVTAAIATDMVLEGLLDHCPGVVTPMAPEIYNPGLDRLAKEGYVFREESVGVDIEE